jgi:hypothetical protein
MAEMPKGTFIDLATGREYVLASTHTRTMEALREAREALAPLVRVGGITMFGNEEDVPVHLKGKHYRAARKALSRIDAILKDEP